MEIYVSGSRIQLCDQSKDLAMRDKKHAQFLNYMRAKEAQAIEHAYACRILEFKQARHDAELYM